MAFRIVFQMASNPLVVAPALRRNHAANAVAEQFFYKEIGPIAPRVLSDA